jgi:hypothetical protein
MSKQLPLSFMGAFFALAVDQFPKDPDSGNTSWPLSYICGLICKYRLSIGDGDCVSDHQLVGISLAVSIPFILVAVYLELLINIWKKLRYVWIKRLAILILNKLQYLSLFGIEDVLRIWVLRIHNSQLKYSLYKENIKKQLNQGVSDSGAEESDEEDLTIWDLSELL